ncbi:MAG TPA: Asp-tRNA(Asn)/Glu-tRNA(Gln) amidotransferase subunit GatC [Gammaproteobacteria bacterium]|nr:Asp-tRNA(Asn)/Glu-tRNA(Gln) amidotransferase subunit GatC [Gammaproteobacteria bacterium]
MSLDAEEVKNIATLARLDIRENDVADYTGNLSKIIDFIDQLESAPTDNIEPMAHPLNMTQRLRDDQVTATDQRERFQQLAPQTAEGLYLVPKVIG